MFLDEATISITGGKGGDGIVSWRREKYVPKGGPDGGDGGRGGSIIFVADSNTDTLSNFASRKRFQAEDGNRGSGAECNGAAGEDLELKVPPGTFLIDVTDGGSTVIADLANHGDSFIAVKGGRGGHGNANYKSSVRQRPDFAELGEPGEHKELKLELKLVADVGIIGFPSVGKSTLISVISSAKPKIGDYPFTTLVPNLGVVQYNNRSFIVCDVPGLIEGASEGKGLGDQFLKHIERCGVIVHLLDASRALQNGDFDATLLVDDYKTIRNELQQYSPTLSDKREVVVLNKIDLIPAHIDSALEALKKAGIEVALTMSSATTEGTTELIKLLLPIALEEKEKRAEVHEEESSEVTILRPQEDGERMGDYTIEEKDDGSVVVHGKRVEQFAKMVNFQSESGVRRFRDVLKRTGLSKAIHAAQSDHSGSVFIGTVDITQYL